MKAPKFISSSLSPAVRFRGPGFTLPATVPVGANPPSGAIIYYSLKTAPKEQISLEILDEHGKLVRKYSSKKTGAGASRGRRRVRLPKANRRNFLPKPA